MSLTFVSSYSLRVTILSSFIPQLFKSSETLGDPINKHFVFLLTEKTKSSFKWSKSSCVIIVASIFLHEVLRKMEKDI